MINAGHAPKIIIVIGMKGRIIEQKLDSNTFVVEKAIAAIVEMLKLDVELFTVGDNGAAKYYFEKDICAIKERVTNSAKLADKVYDKITLENTRLLLINLDECERNQFDINAGLIPWYVRFKKLGEPVFLTFDKVISFILCGLESKSVGWTSISKPKSFDVLTLLQMKWKEMTKELEHYDLNA